MGYSRDNMEKPSPSESKIPADTEDEYPPPKIVLPAMVAIYMIFFLVALDRTIIGTAIPSITDDFKSFGDIAWYESGFLLPNCMLQLSFGRIYTYYPAKWILASLVVIFEVGSIVCAAAPNSKALIVGRVICGIGATGIGSGALILINSLVPLKSRPKYSGSLGGVFGVASVLGPLLGGYLTAVTWRWCFWINLPIGVVALVVLLFFCPKAPGALKPADTWLGKLKQLDPIGFVLIAPAVVSLLFALQWGGVRYPWSNGRIIALFVVGGVLLLAFVGTQAWLKEKGTIPPRIFLQRSVFFGCIASIGIGSALVVYCIYLPIWFQAIQGKSPQSSGLSLIPLLLGTVIFVVSGGIATSLLGYYTPFLILGGAISMVGAGLITTWPVDATRGQWIGFQALLGIGLGLVLQQPNIAAQTVLSKEDISIGISLLGFIQFLGGTIFITVCQTLLQNNLASGLAGKIPGLDASTISNAGATSLTRLVSPDQLPFVLEVYNNSLRSIWYLGLGLASLIFVAAFGVEWKSVKAKQSPGDTSPA